MKIFHKVLIVRVIIRQINSNSNKVNLWLTEDNYKIKQTCFTIRCNKTITTQLKIISKVHKIRYKVLAKQ
jgi:hypothetical protein